MIRKRYRLTLDVDVMLHDITPERCAAVFEQRRETWIRNGFTSLLECLPAGGPDLTAIESTRALVTAIEKDPVLLDQWLQKTVLLYAMDVVETASQGTEPDEKMLHHAVERLPPRARHWWRQTFHAEDETTYDRIEYLFDLLEVATGRPQVFEVDGEG